MNTKAGYTEKKKKITKITTQVRLQGKVTQVSSQKT